MYMPRQHDPGLNTVTGEAVALQSVAVEAVFSNLLCSTTMTQVYKNLEKNPIEAVYTFPLASRAVLLGLNIMIGGRELQGVVVEKASAEEQYEEAITDGNTAIMVEQVQPGLYTMNVGNILASEEVRISICFSELYTWQGQNLRFHLPTTIAPRYGDPERAGLQPHQTPEYDLLANNRFHLKLTLSGILAKARLNSPSHQIAVSESSDATVVTLASGEASMDRDFILNITLAETIQDTVLIDRDYDGGFVALASFVPKLPVPDSIPPKSIKIVIDCSGSMNGDSIAQAREAMSEILCQLRPEDFFNILAFGSSSTTYFDRQVLATKDNITKVRRLLRSLEANMGGTEMEQALQAAVQIPGPSIPQDILLITDGEVWQSEEIIGMIRKSEHRVFTVGVGSAVSEGFVRQLAETTGGACELVVPNEQMKDKIVRHFRRMYLPRADKVVLRWPQEPIQVIPRTIGPVYDGDTGHVFARFSEKPKGPVILAVTLADGSTLDQIINQDDVQSPMVGDDLSGPGPLTRMAIGQSLNELDTTEATALAVRYQLISRHTNYLVVDVRAEGKLDQPLPVLRKVPQMLAAGWGGSGTVLSETVGGYPIPRSSEVRSPSGVRFSKAISRSDVRYSKAVSGSGVLFSRAPAIDWRQRTSPQRFLEKCGWRHTRWLLPTLQIKSYDDLIFCDLPDRILDALKAIAANFAPSESEAMIVLAFLQCLATAPAQLDMSRNFRRAVRRSVKTTPSDIQLLKALAQAFADISADDWGPNYPFVEDDEEPDDAED